MKLTHLEKMKTLWWLN